MHRCIPPEYRATPFRDYPETPLKFPGIIDLSLVSERKNARITLFTGHGRGRRFPPDVFPDVRFYLRCGPLDLSSIRYSLARTSTVAGRLALDRYIFRANRNGSACRGNISVVPAYVDAPPSGRGRASRLQASIRGHGVV